MEAGSDDKRPELVFGLVGPAGVSLKSMSVTLKEHLKSFDYKIIDIHVSDLLKNFCDWTDEVNNGKYEQIQHRQRTALLFRKKLNDGAALARSSIAEIRKQRAIITSNADIPASSQAYIVDQLKHPSEVELLREIYGASFILLAGHAHKGIRVENLAKEMAESDDKRVDGQYKSKADDIIDIDDSQEDKDGLGQNTRDVYPLADYFADLNHGNDTNGIKRFIDLLFGHPFHTPYPKELAMYQAWSGSLRSSDHNRQVGAVIARHELKLDRVSNIDIVASGVNEVPRRGGGYYWTENSPDTRDQHLDANDDNRAERIKRSALAELLDRINNLGWLNEERSKEQTNILARELLPNLKRTQFMNIGEFSRPVHAEMAALIDSAKRGVAVHGLSMYVTTFPCHNCAKHIIAAGIKQVFYLEPYPKSRADDLHGEEIELEAIDGIALDDKVAFTAFTGVAPRQYGRVFSMSARGAKKGLSLKEWEANKQTLSPQYVMRNASEAYFLSEHQELEKLPIEIYKHEKTE